MKKLKPYIIVSLITLFIFLLVSFIKGFFPFGHNYIIWGDLHEQIIPIYYRFYDVIHNGGSLFIDYTNGGGINYFGIMAYYIISPFSLLILLFPRNMIPELFNIIIFLKILLSAITCLYFLRHIFKLKDKYSIILSLIYAFSSYTLTLYIIPTWLDMIWILPILMIGLKNILDNKDIKLFVIMLSLSLITNFYLSFILLIFICLCSIFYLRVYNKKNIKESILKLGLGVVISLLISSIIVIPTIIQISRSTRLGFTSINNLITKGPILNKLMYFITLGLPIACILFLLKYRKNNKKFLNFIIPVLLILLVPVLIEPINKMLHFGSYSYYPYRYGFVTTFMLIVCAGYYLSKNELNFNVKPIIINSLISIFIIGLVYIFYSKIQSCIDLLSFNTNKKMAVVMIIILVLSIIGYLISLKCKDIISIYIIAFTVILCMSMCYFGIDYDQKRLQQVYNDMYDLKVDNTYRTKITMDEKIENYSMVSSTNTIDHFTSLVDNNAFITNQKLGYTSRWMDTSSFGSNIFIDTLLGNKYLYGEKINNYYKKIDSNLYEINLNLKPYYLINNNIKLNKYDSSFKNTNKIYNSISSDKNIFEIIDDFDSNNIEYKNNNLYIIDKNKETSLSKKINIKERKLLYLEVLNSYDNLSKRRIYKSFKVLVNNKVILDEYPTDTNNGTIYLGEFNNEEVNIKIILNNDVHLKYIELGLLDKNKLENFYKDSNSSNIKYKSNKIKISYESQKEGLLFIPINYLRGMKAKLNNKEVKIEKVYNNYIGINVRNGINNIEITFIPDGFRLGLIFSLIGLISFLIVIKLNIFNNLSLVAYPIYIITLVLVSIFTLTVPLFIIYLIITKKRA